MSANANTTSDSPAGRHTILLQRLVGSGQWDRALEVSRDWLNEDPASTLAHYTAGQSLVHLRQYPQAKEHLLKALEGGPRGSFTHRLLSIVYFHLKDHAKAEDHIQQALALNPNDPLHWYHLAWMRYQCGSPETAVKHIRRSLELQPNDANALNLLALCEGRRGPEQLAQYLRALEVDPENESVHNNLGTYYLDVDGNYPAAEESFRRALSIDPSSKTAQKNLFLVLRRRDPLYRALQSPRTLVDRLRWGNRRHNFLARAGLLGLWLVAGRFLLALLLFWLVFIFPLVKVYEYLTLGDLRAKVGLPGARRGGPFGFRRWSFGARFGIFAALCALFWGGVIFACRNAATAEALGWLLIAAALGYVGFIIARRVGRARRRAIASRGEKKFRRAQMPPPLPKSFQP